MTKFWKLKRIAIAVLLLASSLILFEPAMAAPGGNVTISNVSPANESVAIEIVGNPPEESGYVNISFTLTDSNGGSDMEFYLNVSVDSVWISRKHESGQDSDTWWQHELAFNTTNTTYYWSVAYRDGAESFNTTIYHFGAEAIPDQPDTPSPANNSQLVAGLVTLKCTVHHPDGVSAPPMNVTFHLYPSGTILGYDNSSLADGAVATCDTMLEAHEKGTDFFWYANAHDDEFNNSSGYWTFKTYYNDTEPNSTWYSLGADVWIEEDYTDQEPSTLWYTVGGDISIHYFITLSTPSPTNGELISWSSSRNLTLWANKTGDPISYDFKFYRNDTVDESWLQLGTTQTYDIPSNKTIISAVLSGLEYGETYWWYVNGSSIDDQKNSSIYYFTVENASQIFEPNVTWYSAGGDAWIESEYTDPEPSTLWYTLGADISIHTILSFSNPSPTNGEEIAWTTSRNLTILANKSGDPISYDFKFYRNDTVDETWAQLGTTQTFDIPSNKTITSVVLSGLEYGETYWWVVNGSSVDDRKNSTIYHFKVEDASPIFEPNVTWYSAGGDMWVEPKYTEPEPSTVWYSLGAIIDLRAAPYAPTDPFPENNSRLGTHFLSTFSCYVEDPRGYQMNVTFHKGDGTLIGTDTYVSSGDRASIPSPGGLVNFTWYEWYAIANNSPAISPGLDNQSALWRYMPGNHLPVANLTPDEGDFNIPVRRKLVGAVYQYFARLIWNITDPEGDIMEFHCYVDNPPGLPASWNDWISRWHITDAIDGEYNQDETLFDTPETNYTWRLFISDGYNSTNHYMNFTTLFYFWADFNWTPEAPTTAGNTTFNDLSNNATSYWWYVDGALISNASGLLSTDRFDMVHRFGNAGLHSVKQVVFNESADVYDEITKLVTVRASSGGDGDGDGDGDVTTPDPQDPLYPGYTIKEMYDLLRITDLPNSNEVLTVVFIDSGVSSISYNDVSLSSILQYHHPSYSTGADAYGHGTFVGYELAYIKQTKLPNIELISYRAADGSGGCSADTFIQSLDNVKALDPDIVTISLGAVGNPNDALSTKVKELKDAGIIVITAAAGNKGPAPSTILSPACSDSAIAVGASDPGWNDNEAVRKELILDLTGDTICHWSSRGPVIGVSQKPDLVSPGESIRGPWLSGEIVLSGTSFATPLIAAGVAVVYANNKGMADLVNAIYFWDGSIISGTMEDALKDGCFIKGTDNDWGAGIPQFDDVNSIFAFKLWILLLLPILIIAIVIILSVYMLYYRKKGGKKTKTTLSIPF